MRWIWNDRKASDNRAKHGVSFELASLIFGDPLHLSLPDPHEDGDRWQTLGRVGSVLLLVVHTWPDDEEKSGRIISARRATAHERRAYEQDC